MLKLRDAVGRLRACWRFKVLLTLLLNLFFWAGYGYLSRHTFFPEWMPPVTWLDHWIPYRPRVWSVIYLSEFLFTAIAPWLLVTREGLRRYALGLIILSSVSFILFFFFPVASPRPATMAAEGWHRFILQWDGSFNAFPSLHGGFLTYTLLLTWRMFPARRAGRSWVWPLLVTWAALVMISTLATRQHYFVDLAAGAVLGIAADAIAWSHRVRWASDEAARMTLRRNGTTSQAGSK